MALAGLAALLAASSSTVPLPFVDGGSRMPIRRNDPAADGLYTVWRDHIDRNAAKRPLTEDDFLTSISRIGGERIASAVHAQLRAAEPNFDML